MPRKGHRKYEHLLDEWIYQYTEEKMTIPEIAEQCPACGETVTKYLREEGIKMRGSGEKYDAMTDKWVRLYVEEDMILSEIAKEHDASKTAVYRRLKEAGVIEKQHDNYDQYDKKWAQLYEEGFTVSEIAEQYECDDGTVLRHLENTDAEISQSTDLTKNTLLKRSDQSGQCWEWTSAIHHSRYGVLTVEGEQIVAHRAAYRLWKGEIPDGKVVRHKCDNKSCINPQHLELGTNKENVEDMHQVKRDLHALTQDDLRDILGREEEDWLRIAEDHNVRLATIRYILEEKQP